MRLIDASGFERELIADMSLYGEKISGDEAYSRALLLLADAPTFTPPNEPLTWGELAEMEDQPVYIVETGAERYWALVMFVSKHRVDFVTVHNPDDYGDRELYGESWVAYRRPLEGEA